MKISNENDLPNVDYTQLNTDQILELLYKGNEKILDKRCGKRPSIKNIKSQHSNTKKKKIDTIHQQFFIASIKLTESCVVNILRFIPSLHTKNKYLSTICKSWNNAYQSAMQIKMQQDVLLFSLSSMKVSLHWNKTKIISTCMQHVKKRNYTEAMKIIKNTFCLDSIFGKKWPSKKHYHVQNIFEFMMVKFGTNSLPAIGEEDSDIIICDKLNHNSLLHIVCHVGMQKRVSNICMETINEILEHYNPVSMYPRFEQIEYLKMNHMSKLFFEKNAESMKYAYKPCHVARIYRNMAFYYAEQNEVIFSIGCLMKSMRIEPSKNVVDELSYIFNEILVKKYVSLSSLPFTPFVNSKKIMFGRLCRFCKNLIERYVTFLCKNNLIQKDRHVFEKLGLKNRHYILDHANEQKIESFISSIETNQSRNYPNVDRNAFNDQNSKDLNNPNKKISIYDVVNNRKCCPVFEYTDDELMLIERWTSKIEPVQKHKTEGRVYHSLKIDPKVLKYYEVLIDFLDKNENINGLKKFQKKMDMKSCNGMSSKEANELGILWDSYENSSISPIMIKDHYQILKNANEFPKKENIHFSNDRLFHKVLHDMETQKMRVKKIDIDSIIKQK